TPIRLSAGLLALGIGSLLVNCSSGETDCADSSCGVGGGGGQGGQGGDGPVVDDFACSDEAPESLPEGTELHGCSPDEGKRCLPEGIVARKAVAYSGYREEHDPRTKTYPSEAEILEDLELLIDSGFGFIRLFDSGVHAERTLKVIADNELDLKVQLGIWIAGAKADFDEVNQADIDAGVALAKQYESIVVGVSVGNETLSSWSSVLTPAADLAAYITEVRGQITQPVTTDEMYPPYRLDAGYADVEEVLTVIDYASVHIYAFIDAQWSWNWKQAALPEEERADAMMQAGMEYTQLAIDGVRKKFVQKGFDIPILLGEIGWKSTATKPDEAAGEIFRAHPVNQKIFYDWMESWVHGAAHDETSPLTAFYFEAFDEPWKGQDDAWGLFDVKREPKLVMWCTAPSGKPEGAPTYSLDDRVYYAP
ncbi:MAG TPA: hypothetical protein VLC09_08835, partial [Polyangiaceae bacterium]|nr:hypothetical protein [Polyangiaceae bacterium]